MQIKLFEVRDRGTFIPVMAVLLEADPFSQDSWLLGRVGHKSSVPTISLTRLSDAETHFSPEDWGSSRSMPESHLHLYKEWDSLVSGEVIDIGFILGETQTKKVSERIEQL